MTDREKLYELREFVETEMVEAKEKHHNHIGDITYYFAEDGYFSFQVRKCEITVMTGSMRMLQDSDNFTLTVDDFIEDFKTTLKEIKTKKAWDPI